MLNPRLNLFKLFNFNLRHFKQLLFLKNLFFCLGKICKTLGWEREKETSERQRKRDKVSIEVIKENKATFRNLLLFYLFQILSERVENVYRRESEKR